MYGWKQVCESRSEVDYNLLNCPSKFRDKPEGCERNLRVVTLKSEHYDGSDEEAAECETRLDIIGEQFYYDGNKLKAKKWDGIPYTATKMFFQNITRAINRLEIAVVNNFEVFNKLIEIFS